MARTRCGTTSPTNPTSPAAETVAAATSAEIRNTRRIAASTFTPSPAAASSPSARTSISEIDVLALGEDAAAGLGVNVDAAIRRVFLISALVAAATVSAAGLVGFVGLVVPHLVRAMGVPGHGPLLG